MESKGSDKGFLKQADVIISKDSFWVILEKLEATMARFKGKSCRGQVHNHAEALEKAKTFFSKIFSFH